MLDNAALNFLDGRSLDPEVADRYGMHSGNITSLKRGSALAIPYLENGRLISTKFRMLPKERFWRDPPGARKILWNVDCLDDPALEDGRMALVITEGELDALAAIQCGFPLAVSVPDGAPPASLHDVQHDSGAPDQDGRLSYLWDARDSLRRVKRFIIATDNDGPGHRLRDELIRMLRASRCAVVDYPFDCKDINDVLHKHGPAAVTSTLNCATACPVHGLYRLDAYPDQGELQTFSTGWPLLDQHCRMFAGEFMVITGIPGHGKSSFALQLLANAAQIHGFRSAMFSPEMRVMPIIRDRFRAFRAGKVGYAGPETDAWINDMFLFIGADPYRRDFEEAFSLDWIIDKATDAVLRDGIKILLIDPWNEIEHAREKGEAVTDYTGRAIRRLREFASERGVIVIVIAHPTKMAKAKDGTIDCPTLYDISDSSHWANKSDHGIVIHRGPINTEVIVQKCRFDEAGSSGKVRMLFDPALHRFDPLQG